MWSGFFLSRLTLERLYACNRTFFTKDECGANMLKRWFNEIQTDVKVLFNFGLDFSARWKILGILLAKCIDEAFD